jgi:hypothetical protein
MVIFGELIIVGLIFLIRWLAGLSRSRAALILQFNVPELQPVAKEVEETIIQIMNQASQ